jgi:glucokinase
MSNSVEYILLGDIGATNARFALLSNGNLNANGLRLKDGSEVTSKRSRHT